MENFILRTNYVEPVQVLRFYVKHIITIVPGQYDINSLVTFIKSEIQKVGFGLTWATMEYNKERNRVSIANAHRIYILASYKSNSLLRLLGFNKNIKLNHDFDNGDLPYPMRDGRDKIEYLMLSATKPVEADM